jgi:peptidyl-prolyl cis-trans isomerase B (cyclophilin B)
MRIQYVATFLAIRLWIIGGTGIDFFCESNQAPAEIPFAQTPKAQLNNYHVRLETSLGNIELDLFPHFAPEHVRNFLRLSKLGFYDHTSWHRVVPGILIQGGDLNTHVPALSLQERRLYVRRLQPEFSQLMHEEGTLSMARAQELDSADTSFFICVTPQPSLNEKYTVFGKVVAGMDVVRQIASVSTGKNNMPKKRVELIKAEVVEIRP